MHVLTIFPFCKHTILPNLFTGEMSSTCARSLLIAARDLAYVLNISPTNRLERKDDKQCASNDTKKVVYSLQHTSKDVNVLFGQIFLSIPY